ncbi:MAG: sugar phosphate isomerase/epimerase family protein, partial [Bacteroidota bacterium]
VIEVQTHQSDRPQYSSLQEILSFAHRINWSRMNIIYCKSKWEMWNDPLDAFLQRARNDGFGATELYLKTVSESPDEVRDMHRHHGLQLVGQILTEGDTASDHLRSLDAFFAFAAECRPILINHHAGRDIFSFEDNVRIFGRIIELGRSTGIPVVVETHRGRPTYSARETLRYLDTLPELRLTADFSHWMVVHESDLRDQEDALTEAIRHSHHIHARVGYEEGPQVPDPRAPEWNGHVERHLELWKRIAREALLRGQTALTITPEFGPPPYMHTIPHENRPVADTWEVNVYIKGLLEARIGNRDSD